VALTDCPECGHRVSTAAEACPQCGYPMRSAAPEPAPPRCYACQAAATTRCQCCGALSCARHLQSIYVPHGRGGAYELRCERCYSSARALKVVVGVLYVIVLIAVVMFMLAH